MKSVFLIIFILLFCTACGSRSLEDYQAEGDGVILSLIQELRTIKNREQLVNSTGKLKKHFDRLVDVMIATQEYVLKHPELEKSGFSQNHELSDQLRSELNRIYRLEGGRQIIERCQHKALLKLEAFEKG